MRLMVKILESLPYLGLAYQPLYTGEGKGGPDPQRELIYFVDIVPSYPNIII